MNENYLPAKILGARTHNLHSSLVNDDYEVSIWLPDSYETSDQAYPTLYVLDSPILFGSAIEAVRLLNWDVDVPKMIVVGVGQGSMDRWLHCRWRDYSPAPLDFQDDSGLARNYLAFLEQECIPFIDGNYRTNPQDRLVWGTSMGGLFTLYTLLNKPLLFNRYIVNAPSFVLGETTVFDYESALKTAAFPSEVRLFVSIGSLDHDFLPNVKAFIEALSIMKLANLKFESLILEGLTHSGAPVPAFYYGIEAVYKM